MAVDVLTIPCLSDNYAFAVHDDDTGATLIVDVPEAGAVLAALDARGWMATTILITHHHGDHIDGVDAIRRAHGATVLGAERDAHRLPPLDVAVAVGQRIDTPCGTVEVLEASGHTVGHVAYHMPDIGHAFTGDCLMALGCGRVFEGTMDMMWSSLAGLMALPADTVICSGHEYTAANARFALSVEPGNAALVARAAAIDAMRAKGQPTVPSLMRDELATNPFLRPHSAEIRASLGLDGASDAEVFSAVRKAKDSF